jgi:hypothetical protein
MPYLHCMPHSKASHSDHVTKKGWEHETLPLRFLQIAPTQDVHFHVPGYCTLCQDEPFPQQHWTTGHITALTHLFQELQSDMDQLVPEERRGDNNEYASDLRVPKVSSFHN